MIQTGFKFSYSIQGHTIINEYKNNRQCMFKMKSQEKAILVTEVSFLF